jgi:hypothetical protein
MYKLAKMCGIGQLLAREARGATAFIQLYPKRILQRITAPPLSPEASSSVLLNCKMTDALAVRPRSDAGHPLDPLSAVEISQASAACKAWAKEERLDGIRFNVLSLHVSDRTSPRVLLERLISQFPSRYQRFLLNSKSLRVCNTSHVHLCSAWTCRQGLTALQTLQLHPIC